MTRVAARLVLEAVEVTVSCVSGALGVAPAVQMGRIMCF